MDSLIWLGQVVQSVVIACVVLIIGVLLLVRCRQVPYYGPLMRFPHECETIPLLRHLILHLSALWKEYQTGVPYSAHFMKIILKKLEKFRPHGCFALFVGAEPSLVVYRADLIEKVFTSNVNITKGSVYTSLQSWLGTGLLTSTGSKWKQRRKLLTPAFHFRILERFTDVMNAQAKIFVDRLRTKETTEDIVPYITAVTLDIVCETIMGVQVESQRTGKGQKYLKALKDLGKQNLERFQSPSLWIDFVYRRTEAGQRYERYLKELHTFTIDVINARKSELEADPEELAKMVASSEDGVFKSRKPFLDLLLVEHLAGKNMDISDIREEVDTFMFEGHDTTSMGLTWAIYLIGLHPEVQAKIQAEIDEVFGDAPEADVTAEHVKQMKYFELALKETQRIFPSVPVVTRKIVEEMEIAGKPVPVGTNVICQILALHRDPEVFPDPMKFVPERFFPENSADRSPFAFVPFSAGPRNCIGQRFALLEEKIILVWLLRQYNIRSLDPIEKLEMAIELILVPQCPIRIECVPRDRVQPKA